MPKKCFGYEYVDFDLFIYVALKKITRTFIVYSFHYKYTQSR